MRRLLLLALLSLCIFPALAAEAAEPKRPNFIVLFADDLGYGDLGCYGHPTIRTPALDRMAAEGMRFTQFYSAACVCTPSRAALMTGRLPIRNGMTSDRKRVLFPNSSGGLPADEVTLAEALKGQGYATGCIGKWHLGHLPQYLPTRNGFDSYFGIPYSNDMKPCPLMRGEQTVEEPVDQPSLSRRYTEEAVKFLEENKSKPFFLYLAYAFPHVPLYASDEFKGKSPRGLYGDVVEELDHSVGRILAALNDLKLAENTLVVFSSDNGPWLIKKTDGGSAGLLRDGKGSTWEGGMRVPGLAWWPGRIKAGTVSQELASTLDLLPTFLSLASAKPSPSGEEAGSKKLPADRELDGYDISPALLGTGKSPREVMYFYRDAQLFAVRKGPWKAHFRTQPGYGPAKMEEHAAPLVYNLQVDPSEQYDVAGANPQVVAELGKLYEEHRKNVKAAPTQLDAVIPPKSE